ncbi:MAG: nucleotidyltransferase [Opitutaceae bacterium]|nr:nucleotidyltransferase [Opitutaceae bacterium]
MTPDFSQLIIRLADAGFGFVIIGGYAAVTHGSARVTRDLDVCAVLTNENVELLRRTLAEWNPRHRMTPQRLSFLKFPAAGQPINNLYLETDVGVIDILTSVLGIGDFSRLKQNAERLEIDGRTCWVISLEDLIVAKEAVGREHDLLTAKELRAIAAKRGQ